MQNPASADHHKGKGRQVSYTLGGHRGPTYTDWMKHRVDSQEGKQIYSHRMSVVEPVFHPVGVSRLGDLAYSLQNSAQTYFDPNLFGEKLTTSSKQLGQFHS